ncbi:MAG: ATP-binding protein [Leptolyngbya sp. LCM1.Bin17]|nr:MAG: ATP-binding protein [Leptolyngbya sp. LCM1.Bin17]
MFWNPKKNPREVFTPRESKVNQVMYIERPELEEALLDGLLGTKHLVLHGESGSGKSWLYKKVLTDQSLVYRVSNLANASRLGNINEEFLNILNRAEEAKKTSYTETKDAGFNAALASANLSHTDSYRVGSKEPFEALLSDLHAESKGNNAVLVLDNLEAIFQSQEHLKELADLITLLDDDTYAKYRVKFIVVGIPGDLRKYFFETPNLSAVGNRLKELPEVFRLTEEQTEQLIKRGFVDELEYLNVKDKLYNEIVEHVIWITDRIPQKIHEYCLALALEAYRNSRPLQSDDVKVADRKWLEESLYQAYSVVEASMNENETRVRRRDQVIYSLGQLNTSAFRAADVENYVRSRFSDSTEDVQLNINGTLSYLAKQSQPIIRKTPKGDTYVFADPVYRMCIRIMLKIEQNNQLVKKRPLDTLDLDSYLF